MPYLERALAYSKGLLFLSLGKGRKACKEFTRILFSQECSRCCFGLYSVQCTELIIAGFDFLVDLVLLIIQKFLVKYLSLSTFLINISAHL